MLILHPTRVPAKAKAEEATPDYFGWWVLSMGLAAVTLALIVYFTSNDGVPVAMVLGGVAALIGAMMRLLSGDE